MKFGVVQFPGSNCDDDAFHAVASIIHQPVDFIWHQSEQFSGFDVIILPGGFSYGDYLRTGAIAKFSPVMRAIGRFARSGGLVLGVCNGFQILLESGLLPGAMMRNQASAVSLPPSPRPRRKYRYAIYLRRAAGPSSENAYRAHGRKLFLRYADARRSRAQPADHFSLRASETAHRWPRQISTPIRMARSRPSLESATASATFSA